MQILHFDWLRYYRSFSNNKYTLFLAEFIIDFLSD